MVDITENERRRDWRRPVLLDATLEGHPIKILDVSFGGLKGVVEIIGHSEFQPPVNKPLSLSIATKDGGSINFNLTVLRLSDPSGKFGARFDGLNDDQFQVIERLTLGRPI